MGGTTASRITSSGTDNSGITGTTLGASGGDQRMHQHTHIQNSHTHTQDSHNHTQNAHSHVLDYVGRFIPGNAGFGAMDNTENVNNVDYNSGSTTATNQSTTATNQSTTATNQNTGTGSSQNMPPAIILNYIIKT
jgi:hypothetical protein